MEQCSTSSAPKASSGNDRMRWRFFRGVEQPAIEGKHSSMEKAIAMLAAGAFLLTACAARTTSDVMQDIQVKAGTNVIVPSASGMPPGIYPGRKDEVHANQRQNYEGYLQVAQAWIVMANQRQEAIRQGLIKP